MTDIEFIMKQYPAECPKGWRVLAYRPVEPGDFYLAHSGIVHESDMETLCSWPIVEPATEYTAPKFDSDGQPTPNDCTLCEAIGEVTCPNCDGSGANQYGLDCVWCAGDGVVACPDCAGSGLVSDYVAVKQLEKENEGLRSVIWELECKVGILEAEKELNGGSK